MPEALLHVWLGPPRSVPGLGGPQELSIIRFRGDRFDFIKGLAGTEALNSVMSADGPDIVRLKSIKPSGGCQVDDVGTYRWITSTSREQLTMTVLEDTCAARAEAVAGEWVLAACKDFGCLGNVGAGTHVTAFLEPLGQPEGSSMWRMQYGALSYVVPAGWANADDAQGLYNLVLQTDYARDATDEAAYPGIYLLADSAIAAQGAACADAAEPGVGRTAADLVAWLVKSPDIDLGEAQAVTVAGVRGTARDVALRAGAADVCETGGGVPVLVDRRLRPGEHWRLILVDLSVDHTLAIVIDDAAQPGRFDDLVAQAMPIIASFEVHPPKS